MIFNSTTDKVEYFDGTKWYGITYGVTAETPYSAVLFSPTSSGITSITGVGFQPDLVWTKNRDTAWFHQLYDSVRGGGKNLYPNGTYAENSPSLPTSHLDSFDSDGFTVNYSENIGDDHVAWCFKAGGAAVANTDGTLASQVSANAAGGFSIVTGSAPSNGYPNTFGHGLGQQPDIIITKLTNIASDWTVIFPKMSNGLLKLNTTGSFTYDSFFAGTSTTLKTGYTTAAFDFVAYCFASVPGYSKIGSYTGTGANMTVDVGFEPAFVMIKNTTSSASWHIFDNKRTTANPSTEALFPNESSQASRL